MRRILHLSDLHFGKIHPQALDSLCRFIEGQGKTIDLVVVSGDWTQRARHSQFVAAEKFVKDLTQPVLSVPGNHDIPLYDVVTRFLKPLKRYQQYIGQWTRDQFVDEELAVWGVRTPARHRAVDGHLPAGEVSRVEQFFATHPAKWRILVAHHPEPMRELRGLKPHLILTGHYHRQSVEMVGGVLEVSAGSGTSSRLRGEVNSIHLIELGDREARVKSFFLGEDSFEGKDNEQVFAMT